MFMIIITCDHENGHEHVIMKMIIISDQGCSQIHYQ